MTNKYFQSCPDSYVRFKWNEEILEGEFFRNCIISIDDPRTTKGYIRPFSKALRQSILDIHMSTHGVDFDDYYTIDYLIACDALVSHRDLKRPYLDVVVERFELINEKDITTNSELVADCRADLLYRQCIASKQVNEPPEVLDRLNNEFKKWVTPSFTPLRYSRTKFERFKSSRLVQIVGLVMLIILISPLLAKI